MGWLYAQAAESGKKRQRGRRVKGQIDGGKEYDNARPGCKKNIIFIYEKLRREF